MGRFVFALGVLCLAFPLLTQEIHQEKSRWSSRVGVSYDSLLTGVSYSYVPDLTVLGLGPDVSRYNDFASLMTLELGAKYRINGFVSFSGRVGVGAANQPDLEVIFGPPDPASNEVYRVASLAYQTLYGTLGGTFRVLDLSLLGSGRSDVSLGLVAEAGLYQMKIAPTLTYSSEDDPIPPYLGNTLLDTCLLWTYGPELSIGDLVSLEILVNTVAFLSTSNTRLYNAQAQRTFLSALIGYRF